MNKNIMNTKRFYSEYCPGGFLFTDAEKSIPYWKYINFAKKKLYISPETNVKFFGAEDIEIILLGRCFDLDTKQNEDNILKELCSRDNDSLKKIIEKISYLAGRYLFILSFKGITYFIPDSHCTYACYAHKKTQEFSSHVQLLKDYCSAVESETLKDIMRDPDYNSPGGKYHPAALTPLEGVYPLIANCYFQYEKGNIIHKRFYPTSNLKDKFAHITLDEKYNIFKTYLIESIVQQYEAGKSYISLTNGGDSRTVLAAARLAGLRFDTFTYAKSSSGSIEVSKDVVGASKLAVYVGEPHFIVTLPKLDYASEFYNLYKKSFSLFARFPTLAQAYYEQLPIGAKVFVSTISETGTIFYKDRKDTVISAENLAKKWTYTKVNKKQKIINIFDDYIKYTELYKNNIYDYDLYDIFYWEHRNSKWASYWYQECDLSHEAVLPFNARIINEVMLSLPEEMRESKYLLNRLIEDAGIPSNKEYFA